MLTAKERNEAKRQAEIAGHKIEDIRTIIANHRERYGYDPPSTYLVKELRGGFYSTGVIARRYSVSARKRDFTRELEDLGFVVYHEGRVTRIGAVSDVNWQFYHYGYTILRDNGY